jgi:hypothetical protein
MKFKKDDKVKNLLTGQIWVITQYLWQGLWEMKDPDPLWQHNKTVIHHTELELFSK